jgi:IclR family pca regulon transcriptional regulator
MDGADRPAEFVEALARGLAVLEAFDADHGEMTLSQIARRTRTSPAAARRALITLEALGYVAQTGKTFSPRPKLLTLGASFFGAARGADLLQPLVREVVDAFGDAASIGVREGADVIYVAHLSVQSARRASATLGARYPAAATSMGRVLLADLPPDQARALIEGAPVPRLTDVTLTATDDLMAALAEVHRAGHATTVDQLDYGITALAVPVRGTDGRVVAALNSSGYTGRVTPDSLRSERLGTLRAVAARAEDAIARTPALQAALGG